MEGSRRIFEIQIPPLHAILDFVFTLPLPYSSHPGRGIGGGAYNELLRREDALEILKILIVHGDHLFRVHFLRLMESRFFAPVLLSRGMKDIVDWMDCSIGHMIH